MTDLVRDTALAKMAAKYDAGVVEHGGKGLGDAGLSELELLKCLQEEHIDSVMYLEALIQQKEACDE